MNAARAYQKDRNGQESKNFLSRLKMSCRIDRIVADDVVTLCISGRITEEDMETVRNVIEQEASAVVIDLKNVDLVDREAVKYLAQRELGRTVLRNCSPYIREWVTRERVEMMEASGNGKDE
jgi:hypothetical protein